jgi:hypothetical protein
VGRGLPGAIRKRTEAKRPKDSRGYELGELDIFNHFSLLFSMNFYQNLMISNLLQGENRAGGPNFVFNLPLFSMC